jgi:hypothetical protein
MGVAEINSRILFNPKKMDASSTPVILFSSLLPKKIEFTRSSTRVVNEGSSRITSAICATKLSSESSKSLRVSLILFNDASLGH